MKRLFLGIYAIVLMTFLSAYAADDGEINTKEKTKLTKEERKLKRQKKQEERRLKREQKKELDKVKQEEKKASKGVKKEKKVKKEKRAKKSKEERALDKQQKKAEKQMKQEQRKERKHESSEERKLDRIHKKEMRKAQEIDKDNKDMQKREQHRLRKQQRKEDEHIATLKDQKERVEKLAKIEAEKASNLKLMQTWKTVRTDAVESNYKDGKYADLYMLPAWPVASWFFKDKALLNASIFYSYATDAYDSDGASRDISALKFGESPIHIKDIIMASKLFTDYAENTINFKSSTPWISPINYLVQYFGNQEVTFNGRTEQYGLSLDFMRHVLRDDITIGIQVPVKFMRNRLHLHMDFPTDFDAYDNFNLPELEFTTHDYSEALKRIFRTKDINSLGGSASGLGDITLFGNVEITTKWIEKIVAGVQFILPTGKKASANKLWAPEMGNGGCTEIAAFISFLTKYNRYINPHLFLQAGFNVPVHVDRRVPRWVDFELPADESSEPLPIDLMSLADRLLAGATFEDWDSSIRGFSDKIVSVKYEKAPEITARIGNIFDKFLFRRGFMDIFYNLRVKFEDSYRQVNRDMFKIDMLEDNTRQVEHRLGFEYSHQFDSRTRMKAGMVYTFAGVNVPKAFDLGVSFAHSF